MNILGEMLNNQFGHSKLATKSTTSPLFGVLASQSEGSSKENY
jgi:hypothetical protein